MPKHGYRFLAAVAPGSAPAPAGTPLPQPWPTPPAPPALGIVATTAAATLGGGLTGLVGGVLYSTLLIWPTESEMGSTSFAAPLFALNVLVGGLGGLGVGLGYSLAAALIRIALIRVADAALRGLAIGALTTLLGLDAFNLLLGDAPVGITGGAEGAVVAGLIALGVVSGRRDRDRLVGAALGGAVAGVLVVIAGGRMMAGSLELIAATLSSSGALAPFTPFFVAAQFSYWPELLLATLEGLVFGVGAALILVRHRAQTPFRSIVSERG